MASTRRGPTSRGVDMGLKGFLPNAPEGQGQARRSTIVEKAPAATAYVCNLGRRGPEDATQARKQTALRQKDLAKRPAWGSGLTPGKQKQSTPLRVAPPNRHNKTTLAAHSHWTPAAETPAEAALPTNRTLSFAPAPAMAQVSQLGEASTVQGPMTNGSARATQGEFAASTLHHGGQGPAATKGTKKQVGGAPVVGRVQTAQLDPSEALAAFFDPPSPRSPLDFSKPQSFLNSAIADASKVSATAQQTGAHSDADDKHLAHLEAALAQAKAKRATLQAALEKTERALDKERRAGVALEEGFSRALQGNVKTVEAAEKEAQEARRSLAARTRQFQEAQAATAEESKQRVDAEASARAACEALERARAELSIAAADKEEAQTRARTEALKRQQAEAQMESLVRECAVLRASLAEVQEGRIAAAEEAEEVRTRGREDADAALHAAVETVARQEGELARARSDAAAAARDLEVVAAKAQALATQLEQAQVASRQSLADAAATALKERASARALVAAAEARLAAVDKKAAAAEQKAAEARALADSERARAEAVEEQLNADRAQRKAAELAAESKMRAADARAEDAKLKLEEALKQLAHKATLNVESLAASTARIVELEAELRRAQAAHVALETEHETAAARVAHLQEVNVDLEAEISEKSAEFEGLVAEMSQLTDESLAEERQLKEEAARARAERERDVQAAQAEIAKLKRALATAQAALKKASSRSAKSTEELEHENSKLKEENSKLQAAADVAATAEAADRRAFKAHLETEREHRETLIEQLRVKNEEVDRLEAEVLFLKQHQNETANYREASYKTHPLFFLARLHFVHELGGKMNEARHRLSQLLVSIEDPGSSTAFPLELVQNELARLRAMLDAEQSADTAGPSSSTTSQAPPIGPFGQMGIDDSNPTGWGEPDPDVGPSETEPDAVDAS
ncbi:hypothetical protein KFL_005810080 [Klebsormidium nitens]|uniref:Uncharacterized protein n=1 Tax=Klebsormidium nitens TaxID=105231 RepID=A0A1Y1IGI2_KLENI|nr:hypothetical protein KFL_005810080 [Klebsormidium nitens]|eukprot:GAQ89955.1 hypothetical protein KFL_005810080 [Klebsormidium nitens]